VFCQAEDGIRDFHVTGVQTCALPIFIEAALTEQAVAQWMSHTLNPESGKVTRWAMPGLNAFNFLLEHSLGGGGVASLRIDPQGKAFAQQLLEFPVPVPSALVPQ